MTDKQVSLRKRFKKYSKDVCSVKTVEKRLPVVKWLPKYNLTAFIQDVIAGITVGLTAIPQGIAYAVVAGLSPEYGLYGGLAGGFVYFIFGSCKDITVGPTAVISALTAKYVKGYSADFAVLAAFLCGIVETAMGLLHLGFLVDFISQPVIVSFTTSAALQISASQLKAFFGLSGSSGSNFYESIKNFVINIRTAQLWDPIVGFSTVIILLLLKRLSQGCSRTDGAIKQLRWFIGLARNAIVVFIGIALAAAIKAIINKEPFTLIGDIASGLPAIKPPPFTTTIGNETIGFVDMLNTLGPSFLVIPLLGILESVAIAKAFSRGIPVDATQEMIAVGLCNIIGSFVSSMPTTGSFTRTALNYASGVQTTAGGIFTSLLVLSALSLLTSTFYYIPSATLGGLIFTAMLSMMDFSIFVTSWKNNKKEFVVVIVTVAVCLGVGLEYGVVVGTVMEALILMYLTSKVTVDVVYAKNEKEDLIVLSLIDKIFYCAASSLRKAILNASKDAPRESVIVLDGTNLKRIDTTAMFNLITVVQDVENTGFRFVFLNFSPEAKQMCLSLKVNYVDKFLKADNISDLVIPLKVS